ncbi:MAG TPA: hypothetical protein PKA88_01385 [Polyangiaceae bacterium]|nr:hypothetical protein [Polyangiaceae bacterium]
MGTYHTFFVATDDDLDRLFPGWVPAKAEREEREAINPFTKEAVTVRDWVPVHAPTALGSPNLYDDAWGPPIPPSREIENEYMESIENAGAPGLRALPHFRAKNYDPFVSFDSLADALLGGNAMAPPARMGGQDDDDVPIVWVLPDAATKRLVQVDEAQLSAVMKRVLAADVTGSGETGADALDYYLSQALRPLRALAAEALRREARVCHYFALHY